MFVSNELESWAQLVEFSLTRGVEDGQPDIFSNRIGEVRYLVRQRPNGWVGVYGSDKLGPEYSLLSGVSSGVVERFLFGWFGDTYRSVRTMPSLASRISDDELVGGHRIALQKFDGIDRYALVDSADQIVAISSGGRIMAPGRLARLPVLLDATVDQIEESFRSEDGRPLFEVRA